MSRKPSAHPYLPFVLLSILLVCACPRPLYAGAGMDTSSPNGTNMPAIEFLDTMEGSLDKQNSKEPADIAPELFEHFWTKWALVTVRYKVDGNEMRYVYANDIAYKALVDGNSNPFPEGAMFAKLVTIGTHDPLFDNSIMPGRMDRVQVMMKKADHPKARDGWVFALYNLEKITNLKPKDLDNCQACHEAAKPRGFVFSQLFLGPEGMLPPADIHAHDAPEKVPAIRNQFHQTSVDTMFPDIKALLHQQAPSAQSVMYNDASGLYDGMFFEANEVIARLTLDEKTPYVIRRLAEHRIGVIIPKTSECVRVLNVRLDPQHDDHIVENSMIEKIKCFDKLGNLVTQTTQIQN